MLDLTSLNDNQTKAVLHKEGNCSVIASAGSGKTRVLTYRAAKLIFDGVNPQNLLIVTYTTKAKDNFKERLSKLIGDKVNYITMGTFHSVCLNMLKESNYISSNIKLIKSYQQEKIISDILKKNDFNLDWREKQIISYIGYLKNNLVKYNNDLLLNDDMLFLEHELRNIYQTYEEEKDKLGCLDFGDMILLCYEMITIRSDILEYYQEKFKFISVDEFQDSNDGLMRILKLLSAKHNNVFVVGDARQSVYSFLGARPENILNFEKEFPDTTVIYLDTNYRSTKNIIDLGNKLCKFHSHEKLKIPTKANKSLGKEPIFSVYFNEDSESKGVRKEIENLIKQGYKYNDIAILYRTNAQSCSIENEFLKSGIPYAINGGTNFLDRKEIKDIFSYLELIANQNNDKALERILDIPSRYLGKIFLQRLQNYNRITKRNMYEGLIDNGVIAGKSYWKNNANSLYQLIKYFVSIKDRPVPELIDTIIDKIGYVDYLRKQNDENELIDRIENIESFKALSSKYTNVNTFVGFINKSVSQARSNESTSDKVKCMSIHASKGLEFPVTFLIGLSDDILPHRKCKDSIIEERCITYVGISRAEELLYISSVLYYNNKAKDKSQFMIEMLGKRKYNQLLGMSANEDYHSDLEALLIERSKEVFTKNVE